MKRINNIRFTISTLSWIMLMIFALNSCNQIAGNDQGVDVRYFGALKKIMSGKLKPEFDLNKLKSGKNIYALGAEEKLKGEIQIFDSKSMFSYVGSSDVEIDSGFNRTASLLVYAEVPEWSSVKINRFSSITQLETEIFKIAESEGIDINKPFPFLLEGKIDTLNWHVINWDENDKVHTHDKHKASGLNGVLENELVQVIGFYSRDHKGIFTHHTRDSHMHFRTLDGKLAGHLDEIYSSGNLYLKLPKK